MMIPETRTISRLAAWPLILLCVMGLGGCASSKHSQKLVDQTVSEHEDKAMLVVMRPSLFGGAISSSLFDVSGVSEEILGILGPGEKLAVYLEPGSHQLMVIAENADFMAADLEAGKVYYAIITPRMGVWKARFSLHPFKKKAAEPEFSLNSPQMVKWLESCDYIAVTDSAQAWATGNAQSIHSKRINYMEKWDAKSEQDKLIRTLLPEDGLAEPL